MLLGSSKRAVLLVVLLTMLLVLLIVQPTIAYPADELQEYFLNKSEETKTTTYRQETGTTNYIQEILTLNNNR